MREIIRTSEFKRQLKLAKKRGKDLQKLVDIVEKLQNDEVLPESNRNHNLTGNFGDFRECHIEPDWLLIYKKDDFQNEDGEYSGFKIGTDRNTFRPVLKNRRKAT